jgi:hypothetical protein
MPNGFQGTHDAHLVGRRDAREDGDVIDARGQCRVVERVEFGAAEHVTGQTQLAGDRRGGRLVVAGDHPDLDCGLVAERDRRLRLRSRRVHQAGEAPESPLAGPSHQIARRVELLGRNAASRHRQHAPRLGSQIVVPALDQVAGGGVGRLLAVRAQPAGGAREQHVRRTLDEYLDCFSGIVEGGHELVRRVERDFRKARPVLQFGLGCETSLLCEDPECAFGRVADQLAVADARVGA